MGFALNVKKKPADEAGSGGFNKPAADKPKGFVKTGADAKKAMDKHEAEVKAKKDSSGKAYRFWIKPGEDAHLTFLTGKIDPNTGILDIPYASEHREKVNGKWEDFICVEDQEPCPLCAQGMKKTFVGYLTVLDHREREYEKDGKTVKVPVTRRLYVAKTETLKQLAKMAEKRENGLIGTTFEVSRTGDKKAAVGDLFDEVGKHELADIKEAFGELAEVIDYNAELPYHSAEELIAIGLGKKVVTIGSKSGFGGTKSEDVDPDEKPW